MSLAEELDALLRDLDIPVLIGLRQQGHLPTVTRLRAEGSSWDAIGQAIGWQGDAVERWYRLEMRAEWSGFIDPGVEGAP